MLDIFFTGQHRTTQFYGHLHLHYRPFDTYQLNAHASPFSFHSLSHSTIQLLNQLKVVPEETANFIGCGYRTVAHWCVHDDPDKLDSLKDKRQQGNYRKATEQYIELLLEIVELPPKKFGYEFGRWTGERLSTYLEQQTEIKLSSKQISRILQKKTTFISGQSTA